jgi:GSH-dependent disulfide-bond oxidoreductase
LHASARPRDGERQGQDPDWFPNVKRWLAGVRARPAVRRGMPIRVAEASKVDINDPSVRAVQFKSTGAVIVRG